ncbi:MAG: class I SAM-dependent methyltransferase [Kovacikia sp.]
MPLWKLIRFGTFGLLTLLVIDFPNPGVSFSENAPLMPAASPTSSPIPKQPGVPSPTADVVSVDMLKLAGVNSRDVVYHLGSGDGQTVIAAVKQFGAKRGVGVEVSRDLINLSKENAQKAGIADRVQFLQQDPYQTDFREASVITLHLKPDADLKLRSKLLNELKPGTRIVANALLMGDWMPDKVVPVPGASQQFLYFWVVPANIAGDWQGTLEYTPGRRQSYTIRFVQQFQRIKGDVVVNKQKYYISKITLRGDRLTFSRTETIQGQQGIAEFNGKIEGDTLKGVIEVQWGPLSRNFPIMANRNS